MIKLSIGAGVLGIPYAASEAGIIFHIIGLTFVTIWNSYSVHRLAESRSYVEKYTKDISQKHREFENINTFGIMAFHAFGSVGLYFIDSVLAILMIGIIIAYEGKLRLNEAIV
jgi:amino acid permease